MGVVMADGARGRVAGAGFLSIGQETAELMARRAAAGGRLAATLLIHGPVGAGKAAFVDDLLALLFCTETDVARRPCNACRGCRDARTRTHPDLVIGSPEVWREQRSGGESIVEAARRWLLESAGAPLIADRRVVLVEHADWANEQTQNALLKALEEPSPRHLFVLTASDVARLLPTIRSRSQPLRVGRVAHDRLVGWLMDDHQLPADHADAVARIAGGLSGAAAAYARQPPLLEWRRRTQEELLEMLSADRAERFASVAGLLESALRLRLESDGPDPLRGDPAVPDGEAGAGEAHAATPPAMQRAAGARIVDAWLDLTRDLLLIEAGRAELAPTAVLVPSAEALAPRIPRNDLLAMIQLLERIADGLAQNAAPRLALEVAMLAWPRLPA